MSLRYRWLAILLTAGCTRPASVTVPVPDPQSGVEASRPPRIINPGRSWTFTPTSDLQTYISTGTTTVELSSDPGLPRDTLTHTIRFNLTVVHTPPATTLNGSIDAFSISAGDRLRGSDLTLQVPFPFTGQAGNTAVTLKPVSISPTSLPDCSTPALTALSAIQRNVMVPPQQLTAGMTWTDSSSSSTCSGPILTTLTSTRSYTVLGETQYDGSPSVVVHRTDRIISIGDGSQGQHRIAVSAEGTGAGKLYLDPRSGMLRGAEGQYRMTLAVTSSGRTQRFTQDVRERTSAVARR